MEIKQGDILRFHISEQIQGTVYIVVNDGPSWLASPRGCMVCLRTLANGSYQIGSIIKEEGPAVAMGFQNRSR